jgi:3-hydroxyisobutyrate dehydrogenase
MKAIRQRPIGNLAACNTINRVSAIAFLGLGTMGGGMASRLLETSVPLMVWNRSPERAAALAAAGAQVADSPRDAVRDADIVIAMLADDQASREVWLGENGALDGAKPGALLIESSTLSSAWVEELAQAAEAAGCVLIDAPVTGSKTHAASGQLRFLVGGSAEALERAYPTLALMSREILHVGPIGSGARLKLINNFVCGIQAAALAEAVALIEQSGLDVKTALSVLMNGAPGSPLVNAVAPRMTTPDYTVNFALALMHKDLTYALAEGERFDLPLHTAATARQLFADAIEAGWGDEDFAAVVEPLREKRST